MKLWQALLRRSVQELTRVAAVLGLLALAIMVFSVVFPRPLPVVFAMSVGHVIGGAAFLCYLLAVLFDVSRSMPPKADSAGPAPGETAEQAAPVSRAPSSD